jgi:hypothetical protein
VQALGDLGEEASSNLLVGGVFSEVDGNQDLLSLGIDIANIDTTLVCEQDPVALKQLR